MSDWIKVEDRMPERGKEVVVYNAGFVMSAYVRSTEYFKKPVTPWMSNNRPLYHVTHWMPLPEPPKP
jgi:hypothetical protein